MQLSHLATFLLAGTAIARAPPKGAAKRAAIAAPDVQQLKASSNGHPHHRPTIIPQNQRTRKFAVNGSAIPEVDFDIGESYAGLLPISKKKDSSELYFWFFPVS